MAVTLLIAAAKFVAPIVISHGSKAYGNYKKKSKDKKRQGKTENPDSRDLGLSNSSTKQGLVEIDVGQGIKLFTRGARKVFGMRKEKGIGKESGDGNHLPLQGGYQSAPNPQGDPGNQLHRAGQPHQGSRQHETGQERNTHGINTSAFNTHGDQRTPHHNEYQLSMGSEYQPDGKKESGQRGFNPNLGHGHQVSSRINPQTSGASGIQDRRAIDSQDSRTIDNSEKNDSAGGAGSTRSVPGLVTSHESGSKGSRDSDDDTDSGYETDSDDEEEEGLRDEDKDEKELSNKHVFFGRWKTSEHFDARQEVTVLAGVD